MKRLLLLALLIAGCDQTKQFDTNDIQKPNVRPVNIPPNTIIEDGLIIMELPCKDGVVFSQYDSATDSFNLVCGEA